MSCQARILDKEFVIPGSSTICHTTKECGEVSFRGVRVDDGASEMRICKACTKRFMSKGSKNDIWYGWFDCDYPAEAHVKFSPWYNKMLEGVSVTAGAEAEAVTSKIAEMTIAAPKEKVKRILKKKPTTVKKELDIITE